jgi:prophage regulatory protein
VLNEVSFNKVPQGFIMTENIIIRLPQVKKYSGYSRSTIYLRITQGLFPKPIKLGARASGWLLREVDELNKARVAGLSDDDIRSLVQKLEASRQSTAQEIV